jgi:hypothetical protein
VRGDTAKMWAILDFKKAQLSGSSAYLSMKSQYEFDCEEEQYRRVYVGFHADHMGSGRIVGQGNTSPARAWEPVPPESRIESLWRTACAVDAPTSTQWTRVLGDAVQDIYVDFSLIRKRGHTVKMWWLIDLKTPEDVAGERLASIKYLDEYDCEGERNKTLYYSAHSRNMGGGETVDSIPYPDRWKALGPDRQSLWKIACKQ